MVRNRLTKFALCAGLAAIGLSSPARPSVLEPCARVLRAYAAGGERAWLNLCASDLRNSGQPSNLPACRALLARCLRNPVSPTF